MKKKLVPILIITVYLQGCSPTAKFNRDRNHFESSAVTMTFKSVANMNDAYFTIRENNYFEFYRQLFDSVKNSSFPGRYSNKGDTLLLNFYDKKGLHLLGKKAVINQEKHEILFFK